MIFTLTYDSYRNPLIFGISCHDFENFGQTYKSSYENHGANIDNQKNLSHIYAYIHSSFGQDM
jgi:hypothetical protein